MKRLAASLLLILLPLALFAADYDIVRADFEVTVTENRQYLIHETLVYDFHTPLHGIVREIPLSGDLSIANIHVGEDFSVSGSGSFASVRIGSEDELVEGVHEYDISYTLDPGRDRNAGYDEVHLDLFSTFDETMDNISFSVAMPKDIDAGKVWVSYGPYGSTERAETHINDGRIVVGKIGSIGPESGITVRIELSDGYFYWSDHSATAFGAAVVLTLILLIVYVILYRRHGRDENPVIVPTFSAPDGLSPLDIGYLFDSRDETKDYVSMIYYWADGGYLTIEEGDEGHFTLHRIKDLPAGARDYERNLFDAIFRQGDDAALDSLNIYSDLEQNVKPLLLRRYSRGECDLYDAKSRKISCVCVTALVAYAVLMSVAVAVNDPRFGLFAFFVLAMQYVFSSMILWSLNRKLSNRRQYIAGTFFIIVITLASLLLINGICTSAGISRGLVRIMSVVIVCGLSVLAALAFSISRRSAYAQEILSRILGYRDYLENVEADKLRTLVREDPQYFYHNLAYAIVLDLGEDWVGKFDGIFTQPASWYAGPVDIVSFHIYSSMARRMNRCFGNTVAAPPQSAAGSRFGSTSGSHSGFSGFSGSGAGGGGARGW